MPPVSAKLRAMPEPRRDRPQTELPVRRLRSALFVCLAYMLAEVIGGLVSGSLALLADAGHMLSDAASLGLALFASHLARRPAGNRLTYGYHRAEILAATVNAATLLAVGLTVLFEAVRRFRQPPPVDWRWVLAVAIPGLFVNLGMAWILHHRHRENLNVKAAFLHVLTDTLGSVQVILAGALLALFGWLWVDPLASLCIGLLVLYSGLRVLIEATHILMEGVPSGVDVEAIHRRLLAEPGVVGLHDVHVWLITSGFIAASLHLEVAPDVDDEILWRIRRVLSSEFGIAHSTVQLERPTRPQGQQLPVYPASRRAAREKQIRKIIR